MSPTQQHLALLHQSIGLRIEFEAMCLELGARTQEAIARSQQLLRDTDAMVDPLRAFRPLIRTIQLPR